MLRQTVTAVEPMTCQGAALTWRDLHVSVTDNKGLTRQILKGVSGCLEPGHMLAIMGPSGCGKSTLLDSLAGRLAKNAKMTGNVMVNGRKEKLSYGTAAYVTQDDVLTGTLTVHETILLSALIRLPASVPRQEKERLVDDIISQMGLSDVRDTFVGNWYLRGISGGQKRRVGIALELVTSPCLLFLDEPTSGLDSAAAFHVMNVMRRLAHGGRTIVSVIHQPSSEVYALFDKLCLLASGYTMYFGDAGGAEAHFAEAGFACPPKRNPADHFLMAINPDFDALKGKDLDVENSSGILPQSNTESVTQALVKTYEGSEARTEALDKISKIEASPGAPLRDSRQLGAPFHVQTAVLTYRSFLDMMRNVGVYWLRLGMYAMLMVCIGTIYFDIGSSYTSIQARAAVLFFIVAFLTFMSVAAFPAFVEGMKVFARERLNGHYGVLQFVLSDTLSSFPFLFLIALVSSLIGYWLIKLQNDFESFAYFTLCLFFSLAVTESLMMAIAALVPNFLMGIAGGAGIMGMYMLVCGFFRLKDDLPAPVWRYPMHYVAFHTYAFQGFMANEFEGLTFRPLVPGGPPVSGEQALALYNLKDIHKWNHLAILCGMIVAYRAIFFGVIKLKENFQEVVAALTLKRQPR